MGWGGAGREAEKWETRGLGGPRASRGGAAAAAPLRLRSHAAPVRAAGSHSWLGTPPLLEPRGRTDAWAVRPAQGRCLQASAPTPSPAPRAARSLSSGAPSPRLSKECELKSLSSNRPPLSHPPFLVIRRPRAHSGSGRLLSLGGVPGLEEIAEMTLVWGAGFCLPPSQLCPLRRPRTRRPLAGEFLSRCKDPVLRDPSSLPLRSSRPQRKHLGSDNPLPASLIRAPWWSLSLWNLRTEGTQHRELSPPSVLAFPHILPCLALTCH